MYKRVQFEIDYFQQVINYPIEKIAKWLTYRGLHDNDLQFILSVMLAMGED